MIPTGKQYGGDKDDVSRGEVSGVGKEVIPNMDADNLIGPGRVNQIDPTSLDLGEIRDDGGGIDDLGQDMLSLQLAQVEMESEVDMGLLSFNLTAMYVVPHSNLRSTLWEKLESFSILMVKPWVVYGDFNDISSPTKRKGGVDGNLCRMHWFNERILRCGLSDLRSQGSKFTWKGPIISGFARLFERLDRALVNTQFLASFGSAPVKVLPRTLFSDHNPLIIKLQEDHVSNQTRPF
ncbi:hypothetical protein K1719_006303 [Acacia pycnantha]|nr:hypothetical protein K1719_006303 [Acacia pycnantha]